MHGEQTPEPSKAKVPGKHAWQNEAEDD